MTNAGNDTITLNEFVLNDVGIYVGSYPTKIHYNTFKLNKEFAIEFGGGNENSAVNAQYNWWNTTDEDAIQDAIWDIYDDPNLFKMLVYLWQCGTSIGRTDWYQRRGWRWVLLHRFGWRLQR